MNWVGKPLKTLPVQTTQRSELLNVTAEIAKAVAVAGIEEGMVVAYVPHTTAGITIQENADPDVKADLLGKLDALIPKAEAFYRHGEGNSDSHLKTSLTGNSVTVLVERGKLVLGQWQAIYFAEFDGPRRRELHLKIVGGASGS